ncbi:MAG: YggS family pyridoxal phosphate enzyme [Omnitrophica bacterium RIFCSPLOWO2_12_FULL_44_17]|uniref:Pyridoxal phosphate homeostasis protein n=1 Tax=Candidatus Danuiimicrobium aquiferis TaxID=1801832 RepID=A0A1G1KRR3_9BACT|nr:MAG: YggS family pyridoxal phosphate enzyme [Omnitrophica bacterium RIFCSPHIGHO2_02_FULL_45_28]OGW95644.1 MAG: YggS family pyridoxal phosphate enzyme [Omnitrophica bacterium RIFCSPLOWO2_12_FULL_44_17]OGX04765.1 MAG: YggS family pyridoxal phosphate enzyme [Omnitrophica bacterium RIFCSPLOWO2_02_FULL_44_11]
MISERVQAVQDRIKQACERSGREEKDVQVVLVSKLISPEKIMQAYQAGIRDFGENRVQEWQGKKDNLPADIRWHLIGHLQTNKAKYIVGQVALIHSLDRLALAEEIEKLAARRNLTVDCLIQVNVSREETKSGVEISEVDALVEFVEKQCPHIRIKGLMTVGPNTREIERIRECFRMLCLLRDRLKMCFSAVDWHYLSMGMSADYEIAVEEGANLLRIGTAVFGERG